MKKIAVSLLFTAAFGAALTVGMPAVAVAAGPIASAAASAAASAPAPVPAASAAAVRDLLDAMHYRAMVKNSLAQMAQAMPAMMRNQAEASIKADPKLNDEQRKAKLARMNEELPKIVSALQGAFSDAGALQEMEDAMVPLYARAYTVDEMKQLSAFYRTPVGAKSLQVMPQLMPEAMAIGQRVMQPRVQKVMQQFQKK